MTRWANTACPNADTIDQPPIHLTQGSEPGEAYTPVVKYLSDGKTLINLKFNPKNHTSHVYRAKKALIKTSSWKQQTIVKPFPHLLCCICAKNKKKSFGFTLLTLYMKLYDKQSLNAVCCETKTLYCRKEYVSGVALSAFGTRELESVRVAGSYISDQCQLCATLELQKCPSSSCQRWKEIVEKGAQME